MYAELARVRAELCAEGQAFELEHIEIDGITVRSWKKRCRQPERLLAIYCRTR